MFNFNTVTRLSESDYQNLKIQFTQPYEGIYINQPTKEDVFDPPFWVNQKIGFSSLEKYHDSCFKIVEGVKKETIDQELHGNWEGYTRERKVYSVMRLKFQKPKALVPILLDDDDRKFYHITDKGYSKIPALSEYYFSIIDSTAIHWHNRPIAYVMHPKNETIVHSKYYIDEIFYAK